MRNGAPLGRELSSDRAQTGAGAAPGCESYRINPSDITINLYNVGSQGILDVRFPMIMESDEHHDMEHQTYWTNHPDCVRRAWVEEITNPPVEGVQRWCHIEFDLAKLLPPTSSVY